MRNDRKSVRASAAHLEKRRDDVGDLGGGGGADEGTCGEGKGARIAPKTAPHRPPTKTTKKGVLRRRVQASSRVGPAPAPLSPLCSLNEVFSIEIVVALEWTDVSYSSGGPKE